MLRNHHPFLRDESSAKGGWWRRLVQEGLPFGISTEVFFDNSTKINFNCFGIERFVCFPKFVFQNSNALFFIFRVLFSNPATSNGDITKKHKNVRNKNEKCQGWMKLAEESQPLCIGMVGEIPPNAQE